MSVEFSDTPHCGPDKIGKVINGLLKSFWDFSPPPPKQPDYQGEEEKAVTGGGGCMFKNTLCWIFNFNTLLSYWGEVANTKGWLGEQDRTENARNTTDWSENFNAAKFSLELKGQ